MVVVVDGDAEGVDAIVLYLSCQFAADVRDGFFKPEYIPTYGWPLPASTQDGIPEHDA